MLCTQTGDRRGTRSIALVLSALILSGCHSRVPITVPDSAPPPPTAAVYTELKAKDKVRITLRNGSTQECVIGEAQADALVADDGRRFYYSDIARLEKTRVSKGKTIALVAGVGVGVVLIVEVLTAAPYLPTTP